MENNGQLRNKVEELECRCKSQQQQIFELKQEHTNSTAELKMRLTKAEDRLESEKRRSKRALEDMEGLRHKEVEHISQRLEETEKALQERIFKLEAQRIHLEEELSRTKAASVTGWAQAEEELGKVRAQMRLKEQERVSSLEEKLCSLRSSMQALQLHCSQQKQAISELQAKNSHQSIEMDGLRRWIEELQQLICCSIHLPDVGFEHRTAMQRQDTCLCMSGVPCRARTPENPGKSNCVAYKT
ncbi:hypothetical protein AMECASPLE_035611 [Ameca splendens]|uniref:Uncharacterized protein n=1 Tax=Ameca splendens TaxID=208324 RepID=A0ABV0XWL0_9TELE